MEIRDKDSLRRVIYITPGALDSQTFQLTNEDALVFVYAYTGIAFTLYLPLVADAAGLIFSIRIAYSPGVNVTVSVHATDVAAGDYLVVDDTVGDTQILDASNEYMVLYSDGVMWYELQGGHA